MRLMALLETSGGPLVLPRIRPEGLSALNIPPAATTELRLGDGSGALVQLSQEVADC